MRATPEWLGWGWGVGACSTVGVFDAIAAPFAALRQGGGAIEPRRPEWKCSRARPAKNALQMCMQQLNKTCIV
jgi:hypothetical protein